MDQLFHYEAKARIAPEPVRRQHIVFVIAALGAGGAERVISLIGARWIASGHRVTIVAFDADGDLVFHRFDPEIRFVRLAVAPGRGGRFRGIAGMVRRYLALRRTLDDLKPDVTISFLTKINVLTLLASLTNRRVVVVSERNNPRQQRASRLWNIALACLYWRADAIVMQTKAILECLPKRARRRAYVVPNPISVGDLAERSGHGLVLAATGRLAYQKGFDILIDAFASIADRHPAWTLVIWGEGELRADLEGRVRALGLDDRIRLPGNSRSPEAWISGADAFVMSARYEGFCNALGEAMVAGLPSVSFDCDYGPAEIIKTEVDGILVPKIEAAALARDLDRLLSDAALRERLSAAARRSSKRFQPARIFRQWDLLLGDLTATEPVRPI